MGVIMLVGGASLATAEKPLVAEPGFNGAQITFRTMDSSKVLVMVVTGPDEYYQRQEHKPGSNPVIDAGGLADGVYNYELKAVPVLSQDEHALLREARESGDYSVVDQLKKRGKLPSTLLVQSAAFTVKGGSIADFRQAEVTKDHVILDDLIVTGSLCVGFDCINGESFGFDTIRLKENNLRIKFQDTSNSASFPSNDWQITANDSTNGGANKFSIDDIDGGRTPFTIEASAPSHSLYVDDGGRLGFGTSTPVAQLHVRDGNTPTLRLEQDGSSGFTPQTWDVAGNEANFFIRDVTGGSELPFRIIPGAPSNSLYINSAGKIGLGTTSPSTWLHVKRSDATAKIKVEETNGAAATRVLAHLANYGGTRFDLEDTANAVTWVIQNQAQVLDITKAGTGDAELSLDGSGNLTILGQLVTGSNTYPDYVFGPDYELMPLDELGAYIEENNHLPNFPVEAEVAEKGLNVSATQIKLIEKVEELTLYTLDQEQTIKAQEERIQAQEQAIQELMARLAALEAQQ
jgi:hypothetical protein